MSQSNVTRVPAILAFSSLLTAGVVALPVLAHSGDALSPRGDVARTSLSVEGMSVERLGAGSSAAPLDNDGPAQPFIDQVTAVQGALTALREAVPGVMVHVDGQQVTRIYGPAFSRGSTPHASAQAFLAQHAGAFGTQAEELAPIGPFEDGAHLVPIMYDPAINAYKFTGVYYRQTVQGIPVFRGHLLVLVRNEPGYPAVLASSTLWNSAPMHEALAGRNLAALPSASVYAREARAQLGDDMVMDPAQLVIWAGVDHQPAPPRLAVMFEAQSGDVLLGADAFRRELFVVDADTGDVLYQENRVYNAIDGKAWVNATQGVVADACAAEVPVGMPYAEIRRGGNIFYADADGVFEIPGTGTATYTARVAGRYFTVNNNGTAPLSISESLPDGSTWNPVLNADNASEQTRAQVNAYLHANIVRDMLLETHPSYPSVSTQGSNFPITVNINDVCNAFYSNSSINFFLSGGGCNNTAFATVVYHEYGHNIVDKAGSGQGSYGEGMSDCISIMVTDSPLLGVGFYTCNSALRNADNTCQYVAESCSSCGSASHSCGRLLSGCVWDLRDELALQHPSDYMQVLRSLTINSILLHVGTSSITPAITVDFLTLDDDNADITDGTPNYPSIAAAFGAHNMPAPALAPIKFVYPEGHPPHISPSGGSTIQVQVEGVAGAPMANSLRGFVKAPGAGSYVEAPVTATGPHSYVMTFPAGTCGGEASYYFIAKSTADETLFSPPNAITGGTPWATIVAGTLVPLVSDDFEAASGWTGGVTGDTASSGVWVRADPVGTIAQPEDDHTPAPGVMCWVTGNAAAGADAGANDVDNGVTTLLSPVYDLSDQEFAYVSYWRWYSNNMGASPNEDNMPIQVSNNNGATWVTLETVTENANAWVYKSFRLDSLLPLTSQMRFRFRAQDLGSGSLVEAAIDDFAILSGLCSAAMFADLNGDGVVNGADLGLLLAAWGDCSGACPADLNGDGVVNGADLGLLLAAWGG